MTTAFTGRQRAPQLSSPPAANEARLGRPIGTFSGHAFWPGDPRPEDVYLEDIAHHLSLVNRFTGATNVAYSVAEHSVRVMAYVRDAMGGDRDIEAKALLHDAEEYVLNDLNAPAKYLPELDGYRRLGMKIRCVILDRFGLDHHVPDVVKVADLRVRSTEARDLMTPSERLWIDHVRDYAPLAATIRPMSPATAERAFLAHAARLGIA